MSDNTPHAVVRVIGRGYGVMSKDAYDKTPPGRRRDVEVLAVSPNKEKARWIQRHLPQGWREP